MTTPTSRPPIRVVVVDDHPVVRLGVSSILAEASDIEIVGQAVNGAQALPLVRQEHPDVVVMDVQMPMLSGIDATRQLLAQADATRPAPAVLILTAYAEDADVLACVKAGARGYVLKDAAPEQLAAAVRTVASGQTSFSSPVVAALMRSSGSKNPSDQEVSLSAREYEVLRLVAEGLSTRAIADRLCLAPSSIKSHLDHIFAKLEVSSRTRAVTRAQELGLLA